MPLMSYTDAMKQGLINGNGDFISQMVPRFGGAMTTNNGMFNQQQAALNNNNNPAATMITSYTNASPLALQQQQNMQANNAGIGAFTGNINQGANQNMYNNTMQNQTRTNPFQSNVKADLSLSK